MNTEPGLERKIRRSIYRASDLQHKQVHNLFGELGLFPGQTFVLYALWDQDGLTQSELTARLNRSPSTITKKVQRMETPSSLVRKYSQPGATLTTSMSPCRLMPAWAMGKPSLVLSPIHCGRGSNSISKVSAALPSRESR